MKYLEFFFRKVMDYLSVPLIWGDYVRFRRQSSGRFQLRLRDFWAVVLDKTAKTTFDRHYVYHTAWAARKVHEFNPEFHTDIASSLYFCSIVSAFVPVKFYDYRPADLNLSNLSSHKGDLLALPFATDSVKSLSCMHVVEHVGLGRYGDPIDYDGDLKAIDELQRVLSPGGILLFVVPIGKPKIRFNSHRVYSYNQIRQYFNKLKLKEFSLIRGRHGGIIYNASGEQADEESYGCGCFLFEK